MKNRRDNRRAFSCITAGLVTLLMLGISFTGCKKTIEPEMVFVQGGAFMMGCTSEQGDDCDEDETPVHEVTVSDFYIGRYEVTQAQWRAVMGRNPSLFKGDDLPVEQVSWDEVQEFIRRLNTQSGKQYRLPTEAEWEYAARGGNKSNGYKYSGSNTADSVAWYKGNSGSETHPVGAKQANELGIYDMSGNVWEWCGDWRGRYSSSALTNPRGLSPSSARVVRGGGWDGVEDIRVSYRHGAAPDFKGNDVGLAGSSKQVCRTDRQVKYCKERSER